MNEINKFEREELFKHYHEMDNPFIIMTIPLKVTSVVKYSQKNGSFYATMGYLIGKAVNEINELHFRYVDGVFKYYPYIAVNFTERVDEQIGFFECDSREINEFIQEFKVKKENLGKYDDASVENRQDVVWVSCFPWAKFSGLISPHDKSITIPQFIWDKYEEKDGEYYCNFMIMIHHGLADGFHVGMFIEKFNKYISELK